MNIIKSTWPRTELCGTPLHISLHVDVEPLSVYLATIVQSTVNPSHSGTIHHIVPVYQEVGHGLLYHTLLKSKYTTDHFLDSLT